MIICLRLNLNCETVDSQASVAKIRLTGKMDSITIDTFCFVTLDTFKYKSFCLCHFGCYWLCSWFQILNAFVSLYTIADIIGFYWEHKTKPKCNLIFEFAIEPNS